MKNKLSLLSVLVVMGIADMANAQTIDSSVQAYDAKVPQEKIHIHFDNNVYLPGQTVWYKAYLMKGNEASELSRNLYIDWFDEKGKFLDRIIAPVLGSRASGSFKVPQKYTGSKLQVLAYTKWMLNFDSAFLFHQTLAVAQTGAAQNKGVERVPVTVVQFFPEGGDLVENIPSQLAFKALNSAARPIQVSGVICNRNKQTIATFSSEHDGMGKLAFTPLPGETYTAEWKDPQGNTRSTRLPAAKSTGLVFSVNSGSVNRLFSIERPAIQEDRFKKVTIVATMNQQVLFRAAANLTEKTKITASLPTSNFPSGVLQVTVFDNNRQPVLERILFVNNEEYRVTADILTDTLSLAKRGKNVYRINISDSVPASLSLSVTDGEGVYDSSQNILSQLLLSSEIKGYIHNPAYYFSSEENSVLRHLDLVMLTNGWRRFVWEDVFTGKTPVLKYGRDTGYLSIAGKIDKLSESKVKKAELVNLILMAKDSTKQFIFTPLHPDGSFREDNLVLFDTTKVYYQLNKTFIPARSKAAINNTFLPFDTTGRLQALEKYLADTTGMARIKAIADEQRRLDELMKQTTLKEVVVKTKVKTRLEELNERYTSGLFNGGEARQFNVADDPISVSYPNAFAYLLSKVAGLQIKDPYGFNPSAVRRGSVVSLFLDEFSTDGSALASVPMSNVAFIKVFNPPFFGAMGGGAGGAIAVYTKKGNDTKSMFVGLDYTLLPGYTPLKEFYSPNYAEKQINFTQTDLRRTLYWKPNIQTDGMNKKPEISFYNNDISHTLQLVLEGMTQDGRLIHESRLLKQ